MNIFITGASGWIGAAVVDECLRAGHTVTGLVRSEAAAAGLTRLGATPLPGALDQLELLHDAARLADAVIHTAFNHDFSRFAENAFEDQQAIGALAAGLSTGRRLIVTSGVALVRPGQLATEDMAQEDLNHPRRSEQAAREAARLGTVVSAIRLAPTVHGAGDHGFVAALVDLARRTGIAAYPGDGENRWPAIHRRDAARLYRLVLESAAPRFAYHGVAEQGVSMRAIAMAIGSRLGVPVEARAAEHFGWLARFVTGDFPTSNSITRAALDWSPEDPGLLDDLASVY